jgi:hypothetical protein
MSHLNPETIDLLPATVNIEAMQGTDITIEFQLQDGAGTAVDITNDTVEVTVKDAFGGTTKIATISNGPGDHSDPTAGKTQITWGKADTAPSPADQVDWVYEVRRVLSGSEKEVVYIQGTLSLFPTVGLSS